MLQRMDRGHAMDGRVREVGESIAGRFADEVDRDARFPSETFGELRTTGVLGALVPSAWGGPGSTIAEVAESVVTLAGYCGSSALILSMHQIQVACLVRHASEATLELVIPGLLRGDLLLANANSEIGLGGDRRNSICALEPVPTGFRLEKRASTVSYGEYADGILATARRSPDSPGHEQVSAICLAPNYSLEPFGDWDTLGMRGTCSRPGVLTAELTPELVLDNWAEIFVRTSLAASAILLSSVWLGLAEEAARHAHVQIRKQARSSPRLDARSPPPISAVRLAELSVILHQLREVVAGGAAYFERVKDTDEVTQLRFSTRMDNFKIASSTLVTEIVQKAAGICGLAGYANGQPSSLGRLSRDAAAAPLMVSNDRTLAAMARALQIRKEL